MAPEPFQGFDDETEQCLLSKGSPEPVAVTALTSNGLTTKANRKVRREESKVVNKPIAAPETIAPSGTSANTEPVSFVPLSQASPVQLPIEQCPIPGQNYTMERWISDKEWQTILKKRQKKVQEMDNGH